MNVFKSSIFKFSMLVKQIFSDLLRKMDLVRYHTKATAIATVNAHNIPLLRAAKVPHTNQRYDEYDLTKIGTTHQRKNDHSLNPHDWMVSRLKETKEDLAYYEPKLYDFEFVVTNNRMKGEEVGLSLTDDDITFLFNSKGKHPLVDDGSSFKYLTEFRDIEYDEAQDYLKNISELPVGLRPHESVGVVYIAKWGLCAHDSMYAVERVYY